MDAHVTNGLKQYTGIAKGILNIYESGVYELREKKYLCIRNHSEIRGSKKK